MDSNPPAPRSDIDAMAEHLALPSIERIAPDTIVIMTPHGWRSEIRTLDLAKSEPFPDRKTGTICLHDAESFIAFTQDQAGGQARIYVDADYVGKRGVSFTAVLNDHERGAQWRDYRAVYKPEPSVEWGIWRGNDHQPQTQAAFAEFVENNAKDIATVEGMPTSAQMLQMALTFESTAEARIKSAIRLQSGTTTFEYTDAEDEGTLKRMEAFNRFAIGIAPFFNGTSYRLDARLKYRASAGKLTFWYELIRPDLVIQDATRELIAKIKAALPDVPVLMGVP